MIILKRISRRDKEALIAQGDIISGMWSADDSFAIMIHDTATDSRVVIRMAATDAVSLMKILTKRIPL